jgi:exosortase A
MARRFIKSYLLITTMIVIWILLYQDALFSAIRIWYISEIFSHGFFIIPGSLYLIWRERNKLTQLRLKPNYWLLPFLVVFLVLGVFGRVGGIQVFTHISAFTVLPLAIWFCVGNAIAKVIWFPLCFMLFSIPIGEELVPYLQKITADMAIFLLSLTTVPSFNTGLYIEIPQGKFVVAEACSGIRFFIGSLVFGAVYSHFSYHSFKRKLVFMLLAIVVPIFANALRVFCIVLIGYFVDMKYASGADHLIYGWVFFGIVLFLLVIVGESFREKNEQPVSTVQTVNPIRANLPHSAGFTLLGLFMLVLVWQKIVLPDGDSVKSVMNRSALEDITYTKQNSNRLAWSPIFKGEADIFRGYLKQNPHGDLSDLSNIELVLAWYPENRDGAELVSSSNALYDKDYWSKVGAESVFVSVHGEKKPGQLLSIVTSRGGQRFVLSWYQLPDKILRSPIKTKLFQSADVLFGGDGAGALIMLSSTYDKGNEQKVREALLWEAEQKSTALYLALPF